MSADLQADYCECPVTLHKNFARLNLVVKNLHEGMELYISGSVSGYDLMDTAPYQGAFNCLPEGSEMEQEYNIRLPRQLDNGLLLNVIQNGEEVQAVPIGALIAASGYSFEEEDLRDITMIIDLDKSYICVSVEGWDAVTFPTIEF